jgi:hypothetical protein
MTLRELTDHIDGLVVGSSMLVTASFATVVAGFTWAEIGTFVSAACILLASILNHFKIQQLHILINSRMDELLKKTQSAAFAEGGDAARAEAQQKNDAASLAVLRAEHAAPADPLGRIEQVNVDRVVVGPPKGTKP